MSSSGPALSQQARHPPSGSISTTSTDTGKFHLHKQDYDNVFKETAVPTQLLKTWASTFAHNLQIADRHLGNICTFNGMPFLSTSGQEWIKACTGEDLHLEQCPNAELPHWQHSSTDPNGYELPELGLLYRVIEQYDRSVFRLFFPILDPDLFESTIRTAYYGETSTVSPGLQSAKACVFAFIALASLVLHGTEGFSLKFSARYVRAAHHFMPQAFHEPFTLDGLQAILLLCLCSQGLAADFASIDHLLSAASRFIYQLKGHLPAHTAWENPTPVNYHVRHLFWIAYICDKGISLATGLAPALEDAQCDLTFSVIPPETIDDSRGRRHVYGDPYPGSYVHTYAHLALIQSRIHRNLYTPAALKQPDADLLWAIRDLDHAVEEWKDSLPADIRPSFLQAVGNAPGSVDMRFSVFHLQYHHCMVMIHQTSSRCASWAQNHDTRTTSSSLAISVTASRSLLDRFLYFQLKLGPENLLFVWPSYTFNCVADDGRFSLSYFLQASINLFSNILSRPLDSGNQDDIRLIGMIAELISNHHTVDGPLCYHAKIKFAASAISELKRLAQCAVDKANRESNG
ncbi:hypothetical protein AWENTII_006303 [Aspergillus wentii]